LYFFVFNFLVFFFEQFFSARKIFLKMTDSKEWRKTQRVAFFDLVSLLAVDPGRNTPEWSEKEAAFLSTLTPPPEALLQQRQEAKDKEREKEAAATSGKPKKGKKDKHKARKTPPAKKALSSKNLLGRKKKKKQSKQQQQNDAGVVAEKRDDGDFADFMFRLNSGQDGDKLHAQKKPGNVSGRKYWAEQDVSAASMLGKFVMDDHGQQPAGSANQNGAPFSPSNAIATTPSPDRLLAQEGRRAKAQQQQPSRQGPPSVTPLPAVGAGSPSPTATASGGSAWSTVRRRQRAPLRRVASHIGGARANNAPVKEAFFDFLESLADPEVSLEHSAQEEAFFGKLAVALPQGAASNRRELISTLIESETVDEAPSGNVLFEMLCGAAAAEEDDDEEEEEEEREEEETIADDIYVEQQQVVVDHVGVSVAHADDKDESQGAAFFAQKSVELANEPVVFSAITEHYVDEEHADIDHDDDDDDDDEPIEYIDEADMIGGDGDDELIFEVEPVFEVVDAVVHEEAPVFREIVVQHVEASPVIVVVQHEIEVATDDVVMDADAAVPTQSAEPKVRRYRRRQQGEQQQQQHQQQGNQGPPKPMLAGMAQPERPPRKPVSASSAVRGPRGRRERSRMRRRSLRWVADLAQEVSSTEQQQGSSDDHAAAEQVPPAAAAAEAADEQEQQEVAAATSVVEQGKESDLQQEEKQSNADVYAVAIYSYEKIRDDELSIVKNDIVKVIAQKTNANAWWLASLRGARGIVPSNYTRIIDYPPADAVRLRTMAAFSPADAADGDDADSGRYLTFGAGDTVLRLSSESPGWSLGIANWHQGLFPDRSCEPVGGDGESGTDASLGAAAASSSSAAAAASADGDESPSAVVEQPTSYDNLKSGEEELALLLVTLTTESVCDWLESIDVASIERVAKSLIKLFVHSKRGLDVVSMLIEREVARTHSVGTLFRSNSISSHVMVAFARLYSNRWYERVLFPCVDRVCNSGRGFEIDPSRTENPMDVPPNMDNLVSTTQLFFDRITRSVDECPVVVRKVCERLVSAIAAKFPNETKIRYIVIAGFVFLRLLVPVVVSPELFGYIPPRPLSENARRGLMLISKVLQCLGNQVVFGKKEEFLIPMNAFLRRHTELCHSFFDALPALSPDDVVESPPQLSGEEYDRVMKTLARLLSLHMTSAEQALGAPMVAQISKVLTRVQIRKARGSTIGQQPSRRDATVALEGAVDRECRVGLTKKEWRAQWALVRKKDPTIYLFNEKPQGRIATELDSSNATAPIKIIPFGAIRSIQPKRFDDNPNWEWVIKTNKASIIFAATDENSMWVWIRSLQDCIQNNK
jgi:GTPase-activator protein for Ras-like GTPase/SH3 domain